MKSLTIVARLMLLAGAGLAAAGLVAGTATWGSDNQAEATRNIAAISDGMSRQWNADMMHDGIRADVMSALYATSAIFWVLASTDWLRPLALAA